MANKDFNQSLEYGQEWEDPAFEILKKINPDSLIVSTRFSSNHANESDFKGPRAHGLNNEIVVPDFMMLEYGRLPIWYDAKRKSKEFTHKGRLSTSIDPHTWQHYKDFSDFTGHDVFIFTKIDTIKDRAFFFRFDEVDDWHIFNNVFDHYGKDGATPIYHLDNGVGVQI